MDFYYVMHIPSGKMIKKSFRDAIGSKVDHMTVGEKLALVNQWNLSGADLWKYWTDWR